MRTAIYLRISQDKTGKAAGVERQKEDCVELAEQLSWQVVEFYKDNDVSATSGKPRPNYRRMLADIEAGRIDAIIAWHTDRLYRTIRDLEELVNIVEGHSVAIRTIRAGEIDLSTPTGRMLARILGATAQHEVEQKADRWLRSYRQRREAGQWMGSGPRTFGFERDGKTIDAEAAVIGRAAGDVEAGVSRTTVCQWMNTEGWRTTRGGLWTPTALRRLLCNPRLAGLVDVKGTILGPGDWAPILDRPRWERLRALFDASSDGKPRGGRSLLSGLVICGYPLESGEICGNRLIRGASSLPIYQCRTANRSNRHVMISAAPLEEMVEAAARTALSNGRTRAAVAARLSTAGTAAATLTREIDEIQRAIAERESELDQAGKRSRIAAMRAIDDLDDLLTMKRDQLGAFGPASLPVGDEWPDDIGRRSALIRLVVARIVVAPVRKHDKRFDPGRVEIIPVGQESAE